MRDILVGICLLIGLPGAATADLIQLRDPKTNFAFTYDSDVWEQVVDPMRQISPYHVSLKQPDNGFVGRCAMEIWVTDFAHGIKQPILDHRDAITHAFMTELKEKDRDAALISSGIIMVDQMQSIELLALYETTISYQYAPLTLHLVATTVPGDESLEVVLDCRYLIQPDSTEQIRLQKEISRIMTSFTSKN